MPPYQIFARKYRPQSFDDVLGQTPIVQTLKNAITHNRLHQAYLFCGARGVGKTSLARIFAKSVNCEMGPSATPCQTCSACQGITQGNSLNVLEIDGASNTGVDDVRELREQAKYVPSSGKYKIYIIDEVHMLSTSAFNALLKILEEPPPHLLFIFATTEPHKIPVTILSRCQRFDFKRLTPKELTSHLQKILGNEKLDLPEESLRMIVHCSEGSVRDAVSLMDQVLSFCGNKAPADKVREILGLVDRSQLMGILEGILKDDIPVVLERAAEVYNKGGDLKIFAEGLITLIRHLLVMKEGGIKEVDLPPGEKDFLEKCLPLTDAGRLIVLFQILAKGTEELARSDFPRMVFEVTLIKMIRSRELVSISEIIDKLEATPLKTLGSPEPGRVASGGGPPPRAALRSTVGVTDDRTRHPDRGGFEEGSSHPAWSDFVKKVLEAKPQLGAILEHASPLRADDKGISLGFEPKSLYADMLKDRIAILKELALSFYKREIQFSIEPVADPEKLPPSHLTVKRQEAVLRAEELKTKVMANPMVRKAQEILGAKLKEVKEIK